ncbi:MAG: glycosyltransferase family 2 protein [Candidatus Omnitrophica bacterium]|nr:glycosyltransferase family 2 protein [Candidatus Omnitrophota bacterium]
MAEKLNNYAISLVVPVFNEQEIIEETVKIYLNDLAGIFDEYELIVVDDASTDYTREMLYGLERLHKGKLKVIINEKNLGSGRSLLRGMQSARFPYVATNFADRPFDIKELRNVMMLFEKDIDFVAVCRHDRSANTIYRKLTSLANYYLIKLLFGTKINDFQFTQVYRLNMLYNIKVDSIGTFVPPELMIRALAGGCRNLEYRTTFYARGKGKAKCGHPRVICRTLFDMFSFWFKFHLGVKSKYSNEKKKKNWL